MERKNKVLGIGVLSLCMIFLFGLSAQAKPGVPLTPKSKSKALSYSLVGTLAPIAISLPLLNNGESAGIALGSFGILVGPGLGHLYAENSGRLVSGMFIRGAAGLLAIYSISHFEIDLWGNEDPDNTMPVIGFLIGSSTMLVSIIHDIGITGKSVDRYNRQYGLSQLNLQPRCWPNEQAVGFSLAYRF